MGDTGAEAKLFLEPRKGCSFMREALRHILGQRRRLALSQPGRVAAAVLIPLFEKDGSLHLLLTKRTDYVAFHKGQVCLPGGACDASDMSPMTTALREGMEEIGLQPGDVEVLGQMDDTETLSSNFVITPFVAIIPYPYEFLVNSDEVERLIEVPLGGLLDPDNFHDESEAGPVPTCYWVYDGHVIWGATARILRQFLDMLPAQDYVTRPAAGQQSPATS